MTSIPTRLPRGGSGGSSANPSRPRTFTFTRWSARTTEVTADRVEFAPGGAIVFWSGDTLTLAVPSGDWSNLKESTTAPPPAQPCTCAPAGET